MDAGSKEIGFEVGETWSVDDFQRFFHQLNILYNRLYVLEDLRTGNRKPKLKYAFYGSRALVKESDELLVKSIEIHSPGDFNFLGIDKIIEQLRELIKDVLFRIQQEREAGDEEIRHQQVMNRIEEQKGLQELLSDQITILEQLGYSQEEIEIAIKALGDPVKQLAGIADEKKVAIKAPSE